ncbi:SOS response-associated peptidase [Desmospora profundinema]|uniref:Abasic site processing protein n=1 Tax=Desmospora profundinema TaxID=1571184 RepID=A0ABU1IMA7_9BACL|nr:SOS response-associated peptidase [Desmospora profundinema]MDR6225920.1 putative SOS response-associated peptidase YedK [Desmospora profundinema]
MCGRFTLTVGLGEILERFQAEMAGDWEHTPRFNAAPTQMLPVVKEKEDGCTRELVPMRWGLIPHWAKDHSIGNRLINARGETVATKPAFRRSLKQARCLIPADGFFEWTRGPDGAKHPLRIILKKEALFAFAGLWDRWEDAEGSVIQSFTIITTRPNEKMAEVHDRMPVILHPAEESMWLDSQIQDPALLTPLLEPFDSEKMAFYPVDRLVNSPKNDEPACIRPLT